MIRHYIRALSRWVTFSLLVAVSIAIGGAQLPIEKVAAQQPTFAPPPPICQTVERTVCIVKGPLASAKVHAMANKTSEFSQDGRTGDDAKVKRTVEGSLRLIWKDEHHKNDKGVRMDFSLFFTDETTHPNAPGEAIHWSENFSKTPGFGGRSDGCVNLRIRALAEKLFHWLPYKAKIFIIAYKPPVKQGPPAPAPKPKSRPATRRQVSA